MRQKSLVSLTLVTVILTTGCTTKTDHKTLPTTDTQGPSATVQPQHEDEPDGIRPIPSAERTSADDANAVRTAETAMGIFARPSVGQDGWWADLEPLLNEQAALDYSYVQPTSIPATKVTGPGRLVADQNTLVVTVKVPTDVGTYDVILSRQDGSSPWLVARFVPPSTTNRQ